MAAGKTYVTKGYSTYTNIPAQPGGRGYDHEPKHVVNHYAVETKTIDRVRVHAHGADFVGSPSKMELLKEYVHSPTMTVSPKHGQQKNHYISDDYKPDSSPPISPNKHHYTSNPARGYHSNESNRIHPGPGLGGVRHDRTGKISGWQAAGPPATNHPLTTSTNNINEALGFLEESVYYSPRADPRRRGMLDDLSTRSQPVEPQRRYAQPTFVTKPTDVRHNFTNTGNSIHSHEAMRRYGGTLVP